MSQAAISQNPYGAPRAAVADKEAFQPVKIFSVSGRIGRARYIGYTMGLSFLIMLLGGLAGALLGPLGNVAVVVAWLAVLVLSMMLTVQRCHDFDTTGWLSLLALIPLVNLIFWFIPGTDGRNRFGAKTPPNSVGVVIAMCVVPVVFVVGILAAVSIPAYQDYVKRAQQQSQTQPR